MLHLLFFSLWNGVESQCSLAIVIPAARGRTTAASRFFLLCQESAITCVSGEPLTFSGCSSGGYWDVL